MPDMTSRWLTLVRTRPGTGSLDDDVVDEIVEHLDEIYRSGLLGGRDPALVLQDVQRELDDLPALVTAAAGTRRRRHTTLLPPPADLRPQPWRSFARDLRYAVRLLTVRPSFSALVVLTLALGIGANTAVFSVIHGLFLRPLPFPEPGQLVMIWEVERADPDSPYIVAAPNWRDWRQRATSFQDMALWELLRFNLSGDGEPEQFLGMRTTASLFSMLAVPPQLGRTFTTAEESGGHPVVVISDRIWRQRYGADPTVVGRTARLNGRPHEIIGVMPAAFIFEQWRHDLWVPIALNANDDSRDSHSFRAAARLKPGVSFDQAKAEIDAIGRSLAAEYPDANRDETATITRMDELGVSYLEPTLYTMMGTVALVLLIACVNAANLLLARAGARQREFAVRIALGAGRGRLISQLLAEGLVLALGGAVAGLGLAWAANSALAHAFPPSISFAPFRPAGGTPIHAPVLVFTSIIAVFTGLLFSLAPLAGLSPSDPNSALKSRGDRGGTPRSGALRGLLVSLQVAVAVVVLAAAGLMVKSVARLIAIDPGLDSANVVVMDLAVPQDDFYGPAIRASFCADLEREVSGVAGVVAVGAISHLPLSGANAGRGLTIEGRPVASPSDGASASYRVTCPGYFAAMRIPFVSGRDFTHSDAATTAGAVIINESMAKAYWPGGDAVGRRLKQGSLDSTSPWLTVVGVVQDVRHFGLDSESRREMYRPYPQAAWPQMTVTVKASGSPLAVVPGVREALKRIDPDQPLTKIRTMEAVLEESLGTRRFAMLLLAVFAALALGLAVVGVYGVVSYVVSLRTREIGIRVALGATGLSVMVMVLRRALLPVGVGLAAGLAGAVLSSRLLEGLLYDVRPHDPVVLLTILALLGASAAAASLLPARRAAAVDPLEVLRLD